MNFTIDLTEDDARQLEKAAEVRGTTPVELLQRWVRERLVHERERNEGGGKDMSPKSRRGAPQ